MSDVAFWQLICLGLSIVLYLTEKQRRQWRNLAEGFKGMIERDHNNKLRWVKYAEDWKKMYYVCKEQNKKAHEGFQEVIETLTRTKKG